jgi:hypothetical protein
MGGDNMTYAQFDSGSEIHLEANEMGWLCSMCRLQDKDEFGLHEDAKLQTLKSVWDHLQAHVAAGHLIHESTTIRVKRELEALRVPIREFTEEVFDEPAVARPSRKVTLKRKK